MVKNCEILKFATLIQQGPMIHFNSHVSTLLILPPSDGQIWRYSHTYFCVKKYEKLKQKNWNIWNSWIKLSSILS